MIEKVRMYDAVRWIAAMAAADGVVSPSERKVIRDFAKEYEIDARIIYRIAYAMANNIEIPEVEFMTHSEMIGRKFEKFVVSLCSDKSRFTLLSWRGDKISGQTYALENLLPDLRLCHRIGDKYVEYLIECKYRSSLPDGKFDVSSHLKRYNSINDNNHEGELFIALGIGGSPSSPEQFYVIPSVEFGPDGVIHEAKINSFLCSKTADGMYDYISRYFCDLCH